MHKLALNFPILIVDADFHTPKASGVLIRKLAVELESLNFKILNLESYMDAATVASGFNAFSCILISVEGTEQGEQFSVELEILLKAAHRKNINTPIYYVGERQNIQELKLQYLSGVEGVIYLFEDTSEFIARQIARAALDYLDSLLPPLFKAMVRYASESAYSWHTPGHSGGVAFLKNPVGRAFHQFYGENIFRTDLSVSVPELGSLLDHTGPIGDAEREAAENFGADHTLFVVNGNSTANKIVWHGIVGRNDIVLVDRNCHKSIMHSIIMTGAIPVYLLPSRNRYGIMGPISLEQFSPQAIKAKIESNPLISNKGQKARLAVITNSTYDGICYNTDAIKAEIGDAVDILHFDEAWYAYAAFHDFYKGHYAMSKGSSPIGHPVIFATQSTHKLLAAFSQSAMIHVKNSNKQKVNFHRINEAFSMHTSTSPNYPIMASIDVASRMMADGGKALLQETIDEALTFRRLMRDKSIELSADDWWFSTWQPEDVPLEGTALKTENWHLKVGANWHGFTNISTDQAILDPVKVTIICPGLDANQGDVGIPATVLSKFLWEQGLTVEKTGVYSLLVLFSMGITKGKWSTLFTELLKFKRHYEENAILDVALKRVAPRYKKNQRLRDLCTEIHINYQKHKILDVIHDMYHTLPEPAMLPADAYNAAVHGQIESVKIEEAVGRIVATSIAPYPPGIPLIMPGERLGVRNGTILEYLKFTLDFDALFPGFENEIHGVRIEEDLSGEKHYIIDCIQE
jgi:arginine decarboxylase